MPTYVYEPELMRVEAELLRLAGREDDARQLLLGAISTARKHGSWALALRSGLALAGLPSADHDADLTLLGDIFERLSPENDTDYGGEARALLGRSAAATLPMPAKPVELLALLATTTIAVHHRCITDTALGGSSRNRPSSPTRIVAPSLTI